MKDILFFRSDFHELQNLKHIFTCVKIKLFNIQVNSSNQNLCDFIEQLNIKMDSFLLKYDEVKSFMHQTNPTICYFTGNYAALGKST